MIGQSTAWYEYYRETEPEARRALLDRLQMTLPDDGANEYRIRLFRARYEDEKTPGKHVDRFLFQCVNFLQLFRVQGPFRRSAGKELEQRISQMLFDEASFYGEEGERALYWEIRNTAARYFKTCESAGYGRSLFGLLSSGEVNRMERMCRDTWEMTEGLSMKYHKEEQMKVWNRAVQDALFAAHPEAEAAYQKYVRTVRK